MKYLVLQNDKDERILICLDNWGDGVDQVNRRWVLQTNGWNCLETGETASPTRMRWSEYIGRRLPPDEALVKALKDSNPNCAAITMRSSPTLTPPLRNPGFSFARPPGPIHRRSYARARLRKNNQQNNQGVERGRTRADNKHARASKTRTDYYVSDGSGQQLPELHAGNMVGRGSRTYGDRIPAHYLCAGLRELLDFRP